MPRGETGRMGWTPETAHKFSKPKSEAELMRANQERQQVRPAVEAAGRWQKVDRSKKKEIVGSQTVGREFKGVSDYNPPSTEGVQTQEEFDAARAGFRAAAEARGVGEQSIYESEDDIDTDEVERGIENKDNEADALLDQWVDYLSNPDVNMMSESGKVLVDVQKLYDLGLTEKSLEDIRRKAKDRNAPVKKDVYGQAGRQTRAA